MKILRTCCVVSLILLCIMSIICSGDYAQAADKPIKKCNWTIKNIAGTVVDDVVGNIRIRPKNGKILDVKGSFIPSGCEHNSIEIDKIKLEGKTVSKKGSSWQKSVTAVGIDKDYMIPEGLIRGAVQKGVKIEMKDTKEFKDLGEYKVSREKKGDPAILTILQNPTELKLVFIVPDDSDNEFRLIFGDSVIDFNISEVSRNKIRVIE